TAVSAWAFARARVWPRAGSCSLPACRGGNSRAGEYSEGLGKVAADARGIVGGQDQAALSLEGARRNARGLCRRIQRPAQMLAGMAAADRMAMVRQHFVVELLDQRELDGERRRALARPTGQPAGNLSGQPWTALRGTPDHDRVGAGGRQRRDGVLVV